MVTIGFQVAGLDVVLRADPAMLMGLQAQVFGPPSATPGLVVELEHAPELDGRPPAPGHPAFVRHRMRDTLVVERADVAGHIRAGDVTHARFRVAADLFAREACVRLALSVALPRAGALILHASAVRHAITGDAHVFTGVSGAGKSTISRLLDSRGHPKIADELLVLARGAAGWRVEVPPVIGGRAVETGVEAPLASVNLLVQRPTHRRVPMARAAALRELLRHVVVYASEPDTAARVLELVDRLVTDVACHRLEFANDPSVSTILEPA